MEKEIENLNSSNKEFSFEDSELESLKELEGDALKEKLQGIFKEKNVKVLDSNRHLFARAKKAEGFEENEKGEWVKVETQPKSEPSKKTEKSDDKLLERLDKMSLQVAGIKEADEIELFNSWKDRTGMEADEIVKDDIFQAKLESIRTAKANQEATSDVKGETGGSGAKDNPDYWIAKATKGKDGKLEFPEETPKELYSKILDKISEKEPGSSEKLKFYNE